jgi:hypothetical protein
VDFQAFLLELRSIRPPGSAFLYFSRDQTATCFCPQDRPLIVPRIAPGRDRQHIMHTPASTPSNKQPLLNHLLRLAVRLAFLHPGQSAVFASRDLPISFEVFQCPALAFVQLPAGGFVGERNSDAPLGGCAVEGDDELVPMTPNRSSGKRQQPRQFMRHVMGRKRPLQLCQVHTLMVAVR